MTEIQIHAILKNHKFKNINTFPLNYLITFLLSFGCNISAIAGSICFNAWCKMLQGTLFRESCVIFTLSKSFTSMSRTSLLENLWEDVSSSRSESESKRSLFLGA